MPVISANNCWHADLQIWNSQEEPTINELQLNYNSQEDSPQAVFRIDEMTSKSLLKDIKSNAIIHKIQDGRDRVQGIIWII